MKKQIRTGVFETNSSSVHAICIPKDRTYTVPNRRCIYFGDGEFGWSFELLETVEQKAAYLNQAIDIYYCYHGNKSPEEIRLEITEMLSTYDIDVMFKKSCDGYIDHSENLGDFLSVVLNDADTLFTYLFGNSFIVVGNNNDDELYEYLYDDHYECRSVKQKYENYEIIKKGN